MTAFSSHSQAELRVIAARFAAHAQAADNHAEALMTSELTTEGHALGAERSAARAAAVRALANIADMLRDVQAGLAGNAEPSGQRPRSSLSRFCF